VFEKCPAKVSSVLHATSCLARLGTYGSEIIADKMRQVCLREVTPEVLDRVRLWRVGWQVLHFQPRALLLQVALDLGAAMRGEAIL
jgi:hypothetical protein